MFKIGDKVKIKKEYDSFSGFYGTIIEIDPRLIDDFYLVKLDNFDSQWYYQAIYLRLVP